MNAAEQKVLDADAAPTNVPTIGLRFSVRTLIIAVASVAVACAVVSDRTGLFQLAFLGGVFVLPFLSLLPVFRRRKQASDWAWSKRGRDMLTAALCLVALVVVGISVTGLEPFSAALLAVLALFATVAIAPIVIIHDSTDRARVSVAHLVFLVALGGLIVSVPWTQWPLRVAFAISRPALADLAQQLAAGEYPGFPCRAGAFLILRGETDQGRPCLWTDTNPSGRTGFVKRTATVPNNAFNLWSDVELDADWRLISED
jgi:hypothetical protein